MSKLQTSKDVQLISGGYLSDKSKKPITNTQFVKAQKEAEWLVLLSKKMDGKSFVAKEAACVNTLIQEVNDELFNKKTKEFVSAGKEPKGTLAEKLKKEALEFVEFKKDSGLAERINHNLQKFEIISDFEEHGLFFSKGIVKLNKIYTMKEIIDAAKIVYSVI